MDERIAPSLVPVPIINSMSLPAIVSTVITADPDASSAVNPPLAVKLPTARSAPPKARAPGVNVPATSKSPEN